MKRSIPFALRRLRWEWSTSPVYGGALSKNSSFDNAQSCSPDSCQLDLSIGLNSNSCTAQSSHWPTWLSLHCIGSAAHKGKRGIAMVMGTDWAEVSWPSRTMMFPNQLYFALLQNCICLLTRSGFTLIQLLYSAVFPNCSLVRRTQTYWTTSETTMAIVGTAVCT